MKIGDFVDISDCLRGGVFILLAAGKVVFVGKSSRAMLGKIANYRSKDLPKWFPRMVFDQVLVSSVHPDQIDSVYAELIATHQPKYNRDFVPVLTRTVERRI